MISPALGPVLTKKSLATIHVPVQILIGSSDNQTIPEVNAKPIAAAIPSASLEVLPNVTHYTFLPRCTLLGKLIVGQYCLDLNGIDRDVIHEQVSY